jgi:hypothetical protein
VGWCRTESGQPPTSFLVPVSGFIGDCVSLHYPPVTPQWVLQTADRAAGVRFRRSMLRSAPMDAGPTLRPKALHPDGSPRSAAFAQLQPRSACQQAATGCRWLFQRRLQAPPECRTQGSPHPKTLPAFKTAGGPSGRPCPRPRWQQGRLAGLAAVGRPGNGPASGPGPRPALRPLARAARIRAA